MGSRLLVRIATAEALLVLALGIAVLLRGGKASGGAEYNNAQQ